MDRSLADILDELLAVLGLGAADGSFAAADPVPQFCVCPLEMDGVFAPTPGVVVCG